MMDSNLGDKGAAPDELAAQRWGFVVPQGRRDRARLVAPLLGDLDELSEDLQHALVTQAFAGRLALDSEQGYAAYCEEVIVAERAALAVRPTLLLHATKAASDRDIAGRLAEEQLIHPCLEEAGRSSMVNQRRSGIIEPPDEARLLEPCL